MAAVNANATKTVFINGISSPSRGRSRLAKQQQEGARSVPSITINGLQYLDGAIRKGSRRSVGRAQLSTRRGSIAIARDVIAGAVRIVSAAVRAATCRGRARRTLPAWRRATRCKTSRQSETDVRLHSRIDGPGVRAKRALTLARRSGPPFTGTAGRCKFVWRTAAGHRGTSPDDARASTPRRAGEWSGPRPDYVWCAVMTT